MLYTVIAQMHDSASPQPAMKAALSGSRDTVIPSANWKTAKTTIHLLAQIHRYVRDDG